MCVLILQCLFICMHAYLLCAFPPLFWHMGVGGSRLGSRSLSRFGSRLGSRFVSRPGSRFGSRFGSRPGSRFESRPRSRFGSGLGSFPGSRLGNRSMSLGLKWGCFLYDQKECHVINYFEAKLMFLLTTRGTLDSSST